jgi:hypothetical protein
MLIIILYHGILRMRKKIILIFFMILFPLFAFAAPNFERLKQSWSAFDDLKISDPSGYKYKITAKKGHSVIDRNIYMIIPEFPECILWIFNGSSTIGSDKSSPELLIDKMNLKEMASWHEAVIIISDSGSSLFAYNPENNFPELQILNSFYEKVIELKGNLPVILFGISSGAEGAVKFAPFVQKLYSLICVSGLYDYDSLKPDSAEYKLRLKEYGSAEEWKNEQPVKILPALNCRIFLISGDKSIYDSQFDLIKRNGIRITESVIIPGKTDSSGKNLWQADEVKKILYREIQAVEEIAE